MTPSFIGGLPVLPSNHQLEAHAGQYRELIAEMKATVAAHPAWKDPPWGDMVFGCLGHGIREWLQVAPDDDVLKDLYVNCFDHQVWELERIRKWLTSRQHDGTFRAASWQRTVREIVDAHLPEPRRPRAAGVYRAMIAEIATVMAQHSEWGDPDRKAVAFETLGLGTWNWLQVAADGDVLQEEFRVRFDHDQWTRTGGKGPWTFPQVPVQLKH